jgi:hypothetical protein
MRMVSAIADRLGTPVPVVSVFRHPSIRDLAAHLDSRGDTGEQTARLEEARGRAEARRAMRAARRS